MKVMISYNRGEWLQVKPIFEHLRDAGLPVWIDREALTPGANWRGELLMISRNADGFVPFLSRRYIGSAMCRMELLMARTFRRPIFPVMLEECWDDLREYEETKFVSTLFAARLRERKVVGLDVEQPEILERLVRAIRNALLAKEQRKEQPSTKVYISYPNGSAKFATSKIHQLLTRAAPETMPWIATQNCEIGEDWREAQTKALTSCKVHVVVISGDLLRDNQVLRTEVLISEALGTHTICVEDPELDRDTMLKQEIVARLERDPAFRRLTERQWLSTSAVKTLLSEEVVRLTR